MEPWHSNDTLLLLPLTVGQLTHLPAQSLSQLLLALGHLLLSLASYTGSSFSLCPSNVSVPSALALSLLFLLLYILYVWPPPIFSGFQWPPHTHFWTTSISCVSVPTVYLASLLSYSAETSDSTCIKLNSSLYARRAFSCPLLDCSYHYQFPQVTESETWEVSLDFLLTLSLFL